jgi:RNA polymerase sigma factor (sigma-70 family)
MSDSLDSVSLYLKDLERDTRVNIADGAKQVYKRRADAGCPDAKDRLWVEACRMVPMIEARVRKARGIEHADPDLIQEGNLACGRAVETWDPEKGAFTTWVGHIVTYALLEYLGEADKGGIGSKAADVYMVDMYDSVAFSAEQTGDEDRPGMKGNASGMSRGELLTYSGVMMGEDREGAESVPEGYDMPDKEVYREQIRERLDSIADPLDKRIIQGYYGFDGTPQTLAQLAHELGYSVTGVRKRLLALQEKVKNWV